MKCIPLDNVLLILTWAPFIDVPAWRWRIGWYSRNASEKSHSFQLRTPCSLVSPKRRYPSTYKTTQCYNPEDHNLNNYRSENFRIMRRWLMLPHLTGNTTDVCGQGIGVIPAVKRRFQLIGNVEDSKSAGCIRSIFTESSTYQSAIR
jgi:hypothetical protein